MAYAKNDIQGQRGLSETEKSTWPRERRGNAYIFYGEETYLREYYLKELRKKLVPAGFRGVQLPHPGGEGPDGPDPGRDGGGHAMMAERTLIVVSDFDLFKLNEEQRKS